MRFNTSIILISLMMLAGCQPDQMSSELYTSDIVAAQEGEVLEVNTTLSFSLLGKDEQGLFQSVKETASRYLSSDTKFSEAKGQFGDKLIIETTVPLGTSDSLPKYLETNTRVIAFEVEADKVNQATKVSLIKTQFMEKLVRELRGVNMMLSVELPATKNALRVVSDSRDQKSISAIAVYVNETPHLRFSQTLKRRDSAEIVFRGDGGSVYKDLNPEFLIR